MKRISEFICKHRWGIAIASLLLLIPAALGYISTKVNYDLLVYLPSDIETLKGQEILTDDFGMGAFSMAIVEQMPPKQLLQLEEEIRQVEGVNQVVSLADLTGTAVPVDFLPTNLKEKLTHDDTQLMLITFSGGTSDEQTLDALEQIRTLADQKCLLGGMSAMVLDTKNLFKSETLLYVSIAVALSLLALLLFMDSFIVPFLLLGSIGIALAFNMGTNIFLGEISYITQAISAVLQLGVTMDFSIFLYHKYELAKKSEINRNKAMSQAIQETATSVLGSSLTTFAGFLALCTMSLTLGTDIGIVMAKGVVIGLICAITLFPALLLVCDKLVEKTHHRELLPKFTQVKNFIIKYHRPILIVFALLLVPAFVIYNRVEVYYKLDSSIPDTYAYTQATTQLRENFGMESQMIVLMDSNTSIAAQQAMSNQINQLDGINATIGLSVLEDYGLSEDLISEDLRSLLQTDDYIAMLILSDYGIATDELNQQIDQVGAIVSEYDQDAIVAGEGPLMKDLVEIADRDFNNVNITSIAVIFIIMAFVLKSISLPVLLMVAIEFAIFLNLGLTYLTGTEIPFVASIVIGTIQLGATIDYAILLTTKFIQERQAGNSSKQAAKLALDGSIQSIFVSAMCFFAATIGVGIFSQIDMIGSLCTLIARGAIISMIVVVTVVPALLIAFDPIIHKTTLGFNKVKELKENYE